MAALCKRGTVAQALSLSARDQERQVFEAGVIHLVEAEKVNNFGADATARFVT
jgi:hypothetical protein